MSKIDASSIQIAQMLLLLFCCFSLVSGQAMGNLAQSSSSPTASSYGIIAPVCVIALLLATVLYVFINDYTTDSRRRNKFARGLPEVQHSLVLCTPDNFIYRYRVIFRVGCPTPEFDTEHAYIDFSLLASHNESIGTPVRFDCSLLPLTESRCGEMHLEMCRITPMPRIAGLSTQHSDPHGNIYLYEYELQDAITDEVLEIRQFHLYITNRANIYRGQPFTGNESAHDVLMHQPVIPFLEWTQLELAIISSLVLVFGGVVGLLAEYNDIYPINEHQDGSLYRSLFDVLYSTPPSLVLLCLVAPSFKYYLKHQLIQCQYTLEKQTSVPFWRTWTQICLIFMALASIVIAAAYIYYGLLISAVKSLYWLGGFLITAVCTLGIWSIANAANCLRDRYEHEALEGAPTMDATRNAAHLKPQMPPSAMQKTVFFTKPSNSIKGTEVNSSCPGPKLFNPKYEMSKLKHDGKHRKGTCKGRTGSSRSMKQRRTSTSRRLTTDKKRRKP